jgi:hypothetical protein
MDVSDNRVYHHFMVIFKVWKMLLQSPLVSEVDQGTKNLDSGGFRRMVSVQRTFR